MNGARFSAIAHADVVFCSPMNAARADQLVELLELNADSRILDVGCGKAEVLLRAMQRHGCTGVGVDPNGEFLRKGQDNAQARDLSGHIHWHEARVGEVALEPGSFDAAICIGSTHAFGSFTQALHALAALVRPGGQLLLGDLYWKEEPASEYQAFLGIKTENHFSHAKNEAAGLAAGLAPLYSCVSSADEWDHYEGMYCRAIERFVRDHPLDPDAQSFGERIRAWRDAYRRWGRDTLGFGFYLFGKHAGRVGA